MTGNNDSRAYKLSFTSASLYLSESIKIAHTYLETKDWDLTKAIVQKENILQSRTKSSSVRLYQELAQRLQTLSQNQIELFVEGSLQEQKQLLWFAVCQCYDFIKEFAIEVLLEKYLVLDYELREFDYDSFFNRKADWHIELDQITDTTRDKLKQVLFRMLKEADLISDISGIQPAMLSSRLIDTLQSDAPMSYRVFPISDHELQGLIHNG